MRDHTAQVSWTPALAIRLYYAGFLIPGLLFVATGNLWLMAITLAYGVVGKALLARWVRRRPVDASEELLPPLEPHPRLASYDAQVARISDGGEQVGWLLAFASWHSRRRGHLWWRRTNSSEHALEVWCLLPAPVGGRDGAPARAAGAPTRQDFFIVDVEEMEALLDDWQAGRMPWREQVFELQWLDRAGSAEAAVEVFDWVATDRALPGAPSLPRGASRESVQASADAVVRDMTPRLVAVGVNVVVVVRRHWPRPGTWRLQIQVSPDSGFDTFDYLVGEDSVTASRLGPGVLSLPQSIVVVRKILERYAVGERPPFAAEAAR